MRTLVLLNRKANSDAAGRKWQTFSSVLREALPAAPLVLDETQPWEDALADACAQGQCLVVAAGGDGTVSRVANLLLAQPEALRESAILGAVGLGTSNDFHKPVGRRARVSRVPVRCSPRRTIRQDVLRIKCANGTGPPRITYALTSASLGVVALGNDLFNRQRGLVGASRRLGAGAAIWCASVVSLCKQRGVVVRLSVDDQPVHDGPILLLGFYVNRHFAGGLTYPDLADGTSGAMGVSVVPDVGLVRRAALLLRAARRGLPGPPSALHMQAASCRCTAAQPTLVEIDGEVTRASDVSVRVVPQTLRVCA